MKDKIKVTVVTGFLGAGKTTFINNILHHNQHLQFGLVENEFGTIALDTQLIKGVDASQLLELKQGCICCTIVDEYELVLEELAERYNHINHLIIETTGIADPAPIIQPFFSNNQLVDKFTVNGTYCLIDAMNYNNSVEHSIKEKQIAVADKIIITKSEGKLSTDLAEIYSEITSINPVSGIITYVDFNFSKFEIGKSFQWKKSPKELSHHKIQTKTISFDQPINRLHFERWLSYTLSVHQLEVYRCKGILAFENELYQFILQGVGGSYELIESDQILIDNESYIVFIGQLEGVNLHYDSNQSP